MPKLDLQPAHLRVLREVLDEHVPGAEVWAYGSRVNGQAHDGSDLDLVVRDPAGLSQPQRGLQRLRDALSESNLPILVDVLDWARLPEDIRREIERQHVLICPVAATGQSQAAQPAREGH